MLRFLIAYGFRNIQNVVKLLRAGGGPSGYDYVELMSCPGGCFNGAGQVIAAAEPTPRTLTARLIAAIARLLPAKYAGLLRPRPQAVDLRATVAAAEARFRAEAEYVPAGDPACGYFAHVLGMIQDALGLELRLRAHGGAKRDIKW